MADNAEQAELWNGRLGKAWVNVEDYIDGMMAPLSTVALEAVNAKPSDRIIDIGCGCGTTSFSLGATGAAVWGVDISTAMIDRANEKDNAAGNVAFSVGDAASQQYTADHTVVFSRFGVMFFADSVKENVMKLDSSFFRKTDEKSEMFDENSQAFLRLIKSMILDKETLRRLKSERQKLHKEDSK